MEELLKLSALKNITSAFDQFTTVEDADIDPYYKEVFPHHCECGGEFIISTNTTQLQCCNPFCHVKMAYSLSYFISKLGFKDFGEASSLRLIEDNLKELKYPTFLSAFLLPPQNIYYSLGDSVSTIFENIRNDLQTRSFNFIDVVSALGIPGIGSRSALFDVVKSPVTLLQYALQNNTDELCNICRIQAPSTLFYLRMHRIDIVTLFANVVPHVISTPSREVYVAITGKVSVNGVDYTRSGFIALCESIMDGDKPAYKVVETKAESKLQYVIADSPSSSEKYKLGKKLNIITTADDFYNALLSAVSKTSTPEEASVDKEKEEVIE